LIESLGAKAVATTSAAVAWAHGYRDGDQLPAELVIATAVAIVGAVRVPVSIDFEGGFSSDPAAVASLAGRLVDAGVAGINLEDGGGTVELTCAKIEAIRARAEGLYVNARTDVFLRALAPAGERVAEVVKRAKRYREAGASGLFVPGVSARAEIAEIVAAVGMPVNVMVVPGLPGVSELGTIGVRRLSAGSAIAQAAWGRAAALARGFLGGESGAVEMEGALGYGEINALMARS
jgi:2-methylisocitrate lyase-like PEP mutase family enzyme